MYAVFDTDLVLLHSCLLSLDGLSAQQMKYTAARILAASPFIVKPVAFSGRIPKWGSTLLYLWHRLYRAKSSHPSPKNRPFTDHRPLTTVFWASGPSALPCAGAAPPQRPALASDRVQSSPAICLANSVSSPTGPVGAGLVPALCPPNQRTPLRARPCACPMSLQEPVINSRCRWHNLPAILFPLQTGNAPLFFRPLAQIGDDSHSGHCVSVTALPWLPLFSLVHLPMTRTPGTLNRCQLNAIVISCRLRNDLILRARTKQKIPIRNPSHLRGTPRPHRLGLPLRIDNPSGRGAASWRPQPPGLACLSGPAATESQPWTPPPCQQLPQRPARTTGIYPGSRCAACAPRHPSSRRHRPKRP